MKATFPLIVAVVIAVVSLSCHESLPVRADPGNVFSAQLDAHYIIDPNQNDVWVCMTVVNIYEETLQARLLVEGQVTITLAADTSVHRTIPLSPENAWKGPFDPGTKTLTMDPGDTVMLTAIWDFIDDNGKDVRANFPFTMDPSCPYRLIASQSFLIQARAKILDHTDEVIFPSLQFTREFADQFIPTKICRPASFESICH